MNVLIISTNRTTLPMPVLPFGACMVAEAAEQAGHKVRVFDFMFEKDAIQKLKKEFAKSAPDIVGLSIRNIDNNDYENPVFFIEALKPVIDTVRSLTDSTIVIGGTAIAFMQKCLRGDGRGIYPYLIRALSLH